MTATTDELRTIRAALASALQKIDRLIRRSNNDSSTLTPEDVRELSMAKAIVWVLEDSAEAMSPVQIWETLRAVGRQDRKDSVSVSTYDLAKAGRIERVDRGLYRRNLED